MGYEIFLFVLMGVYNRRVGWRKTPPLGKTPPFEMSYLAKAQNCSVAQTQNIYFVTAKQQFPDQNMDSSHQYCQS